MSSVSSVRETLAGYLAGRVKAEQVAAEVAAEYYRAPSAVRRAPLRPLIDVIERAAPGVVELAGSTQAAGFEVRLAERPFPKQYEAELRRVAEAYLAQQDVGPAYAGPVARLLQAMRRLFTASG